MPLLENPHLSFRLSTRLMISRLLISQTSSSSPLSSPTSSPDVDKTLPSQAAQAARNVGVSQTQAQAWALHVIMGTCMSPTGNSAKMRRRHLC